MTKLKIAGSFLFSDGDCLVHQGFLGDRILGNDSAAIQERHRREEAAEKFALLPYQGKNAADGPCFLRHEVKGGPAEAVFDRHLPAPAVVVAAVRMPLYEIIPKLCVSRFACGANVHGQWGLRRDYRVVPKTRSAGFVLRNRNGSI